MEAEHQDDKQSHRDAGVFVSCQALPATNSKCIQARLSPPTYISPASLRYAKDVQDTLTVFVHHAVGVFQPPFCCFCCLVRAATARKVTYGASLFKLVIIHF